MNQTTTSWNDTQKLLAFILVISFIFIIFVWMFHAPDPNAATTSVLNTLVGTLGGFTAAVVTFYFGNSRASASKDSTIAALASPPSGGTNGNSTTATPVVTPEAPKPAG